MKKILPILVLAIVAAAATIPLWGGCNLNHTLCDNWCGLRYMDSDVQASICQANCAAKKAGCVASEAAQDVGRMLDDANRR